MIPQPYQLRTLTMISTATLEDLLLETSDHPDRCCESVFPQCSNEAVRRLFWKPAVEVEEAAPDAACRCYRSSLACLRCFEAFNDNHGGIITCSRCERFMQLARAEAIR